jgi:hypothetical protein
MSQTEESSRRLSPPGVRKRWEKIRGIEDEDDDEYENDAPRMSGSSSLPLPMFQRRHWPMLAGPGHRSGNCSGDEQFRSACCGLQIIAQSQPRGQCGR